MNTEKCPFCGASVKKENLKGHYERVHPKGQRSLGQPQAVIRSGSVFKSHRGRNVLVLSLVVLAVLGGAFLFNSFVANATMKLHWHPHLSATINGNAATIPGQIGIDPQLWHDHSLDQYGIGMAPLHTHDPDGKIHEESNTVRDFTLQEFLAIWGQSVDGSQVLGHPVDPGHRAYIVVDGVQQSPTQTVILHEGEQIQIICGP
ncbi:hypothetical protein E6H29_03015 [Candidatus Bathyarchaeota archaeon]|nr:MAG: hypothetical protein E6H29_03015 [Candidatus Bathyarchaeota archaeon]